MCWEANLWRGAILSPIPGEGGLQPIVCCQPARSSTGGFSGCVARWFFWLCRQVVFLAVTPGCFLAVSPGCFLAVSPGCFLAVSPGLLLTVSSGGFWLVLPGFVFLTFVSVS